MHRFPVDVQHRPDHNGIVSPSLHLRFFEVLEAANEGWTKTLERTGREDLTPVHLAVVNVTADYGREMFTGEVIMDVKLERIGNASITFTVAMEQGGDHAASVRFVLVQVGDDRVKSVPFTPEQRATLTQLQTG